MKLLVQFPIFVVLLLIANSCGSSPDEDSMRDRPIPSMETTNTPVSSEGMVIPGQAAIPINPALPVANRVAGRPGFVFNPYNQNMVEVNGLPSGTKARDPQDPNPSHIFLIP